jgi:hypothetical protein
VKFLKEHVSPTTAYVVEDYPYGFRLRCKMRYWIEYKPKKGFRLVSQTSNPKRDGLVWNKPKAGTYALFGMAMYLDGETNHVRHSCLTEYSTAAEARAWRDEYGSGVPEAHRPVTERWVAAKTRYEAERGAA